VSLRNGGDATDGLDLMGFRLARDL
jgi:hypothetical protein